MPALPTFTFDIGRLPFRFEPSVLRLPPLGPGSTPAVVFSPSAPRPSPHPSSKRPTSPESPGDAHRRIEVTLVRETFNIAARGHERHLATIFSRVARDAILDHLRVSGRSRVIWTRPVHTHTLHLQRPSFCSPGPCLRACLALPGIDILRGKNGKCFSL